MKVKMNESVATLEYSLKRYKEYDLPSKLANELVKLGRAEKIKTSKKDEE